MTTQLLDLVPRRRLAPPVEVMAGVSLARLRIHEFCGPARRSLALMTARALTGTVIWIRPGWTTEQPYPPGVAGIVDPGRLLMVAPERSDDLLWAMEEALRSGAAMLTVVELPEPPGLTPVRRLQLAAETGAETGPHRPTGVVLTPGDGGAAGVESRWHVAPRHGPEGPCWQLERRRARGQPIARWLAEPAPDGGWRPVPAMQDEAAHPEARDS